MKEWSSHRLLVNGDDLLTKEPRSDTNLRDSVVEEGSKIGLVVNESKTLVSPTDCEINSTYFSSGQKVRKFNASSIWMDAGTEDVLGFASQATRNGREFRKVVRANCNILAKQSDKHLDEMSSSLQGICRTDPKIRKALTSMPESTRTVKRGVISMAQRPESYILSRDEECEALTNEIERVRERGVARMSQRQPKFRTRAIPNARSYRSVLKFKRDGGQDLIPACYYRAYIQKVKDALVCEDVAGLTGELLPPGDGSVINVLVDNLRAFKLTRNSSANPGTDDFSSGNDFVSLDC